MRCRSLLLLTLPAILLLNSSAPAALTERERALHVLNRLGFGPRPGDVEAVLRIGVDRYVAQQLHPESIDDRAVERKLQRYETLGMSEAEIGTRFLQPMLAARRSRKDQKTRTTATPAAADGQGAVTPRVPAGQRNRRLVEELVAARITRATESQRQLNEVMADFWLNHFNVYAGKGIDRFLLTSYERDTIRPNLWGTFDQLLMATAKSPAMLFYLDNARSVADAEHRPSAGSAMTRRMRGNDAGKNIGNDAGIEPSPRQRAGGLNENYAREVMELHTLGVDGGYTQRDVTELARVLTGWSIARPGARPDDNEGSGFVFRARQHDAGAKTLLGVRIAAGGGMEEGERMLHFLANQPATAQHISYQLCQRLVADDPPPALVKRVAAKFLATKGDLRQVVGAIVTSPEFFDRRNYRSKVKSPFEFVASAVRATAATVTEPMILGRTLREMAEGLYEAQPPTGYADVASAWINSGALLSRMNFALSLTASSTPGVEVNVAQLLPASSSDGADAGSIARMARAVMGEEVSAATEETIARRLNSTSSGAGRLPLLAGLLLGSPEFQKQ